MRQLIVRPKAFGNYRARSESCFARGDANLSIELVDIETPVAAMKAWQILGKKVTLAPFLRAGVGLPDGLLAWSLPPGWPISTFTALQGVVGGETFGTRWRGKLGETSRRTIRPILA